MAHRDIFAASSETAPGLIWSLARLLPHGPAESCAAAFVAGGVILFAEKLSAGDEQFVDIRIRTIVQRALEIGADALAIGHNHPSGDPAPSRADVAATKRLRELCTALDLDLLDHLIFAGQAVHSMKWGRTTWISPA